MPTAEPNELPDRAALIREIWIASISLLVTFTLLKQLGPLIPFVGDHVGTIAIGIQLYVPILLIGRRGITGKNLGLTLERWKQDLALVAIFAAVTTVPFAVGHHLWMTKLFHRTYAFHLPSDLLEQIATQIFVVALAEELFYRGYLQGRLEQIWPAKRTLFGAPFGAAILAAAAVFAMAHFAGEWRPDRLGPFFPALVFGLMRARTGTIIGAIGYHAYCNVLGLVLGACYH